jgi:large subunit ribosomal protein L29
MKAKEIRSKSVDKIEELLVDARENYFKLRFQFSSGQLTDSSKLRTARQTIARIETILRESKLMVVEGGEE